MWPEKYKFKGFVSEWIEWVKKNHMVGLRVLNNLSLHKLKEFLYFLCYTNLIKQSMWNCSGNSKRILFNVNNEIKYFKYS